MSALIQNRNMCFRSAASPDSVVDKNKPPSLSVLLMLPGFCSAPLVEVQLCLTAASQCPYAPPVPGGEVGNVNRTPVPDGASGFAAAPRTLKFGISVVVSLESCRTTPEGRW